MQRLVLSFVFAIASAAAWVPAPHAQGAARANWLTDGGDAQRTSWQRHETLIRPALAPTKVTSASSASMIDPSAAKAATPML